MMLRQLSCRRWHRIALGAAGVCAMTFSAMASPGSAAPEAPVVQLHAPAGAIVSEEVSQTDPSEAPLQVRSSNTESLGTTAAETAPVQPEPVISSSEPMENPAASEEPVDPEIPSQPRVLDSAAEIPAPEAQDSPKAPEPASAVSEEASAPLPLSSVEIQPQPIQPVPAAVDPDPVAFGMANVEQIAQDLASRPYQNPDGSVPEFLLKLTEAQWSKIKFRPEAALWNGMDLPFEIQFFHPGLVYDRLVTIHVIDSGAAQPWPFSSGQFIYPDGDMAANVEAAKIGYAGFQILHRRKSSEAPSPAAVFLGASYFRGIGGDSSFGLSARGLALNTATAKGEEFPYFREFWIEKPTPGAPSLTVYALLDAPSTTGAYRFVITPGDRTAMDVDCTLFFREETEKPGLAPLTSMFLYSETANGRPGDFRPEVHDSDGLLLKTQEDRWLWRPLSNPPRLKISSFPMENPLGFGLMQRDADFDHYQDLSARYEQHPSLWIEPKGSWGAGQLELIEIPSDREINDNIVAFWVPDKPAKLDANGAPIEGVRAYPDRMSLSYRMSWLPAGQLPHPYQLGRVAATRKTATADPAVTRFIVDFEGGDLEQMGADAGLSSLITVTGDAKVLEKDLTRNPVTGGWRLSFLLSLPQPDKLATLIPARDPRGGVRITAVLKKGDNLPDPLTEIWTWDQRP